MESMKIPKTTKIKVCFKRLVHISFIFNMTKRELGCRGNPHTCLQWCKPSHCLVPQDGRTYCHAKNSKWQCSWDYTRHIWGDRIGLPALCSTFKVATAISDSLSYLYHSSQNRNFYDPVISLLGTYPRIQNTNLKRYVYLHVQCSITYNGLWLRTTYAHLEMFG